VQTFPLARVAEAHRVGEAGRATGKLVLLVDELGDPCVPASPTGAPQIRTCALTYDVVTL
jgi:hypothetical protein